MLFMLMGCGDIPLYEEDLCELNGYPPGHNLVVMREPREPYDYCFVTLSTGEEYFYIGDINCPEQVPLYDVTEVKINGDE